MTTEKTLTEDELTRVKELNRRLYDSLLAIGDMETSIVTLTERKNVALTEHKKTVATMTELQAELGKKYEATKVDMSTGVLS
tara:strand:- start:177 stop:422 length:246 start_codon:yes stop_codon:yes gene_type:complete